MSTPAVRFLAKKEGININDVPATGKGGRVTKTDILNFMNKVDEPEQIKHKQPQQGFLGRFLDGDGPEQVSQVEKVTTAAAARGAARGPTIGPLYGVTEHD